MRTVIETPEFEKKSKNVFSDTQLEDFINYIAVNYEAGDVIPGSHGLRKIRWAVKGKGKRGGARVIYYNVDAEYVVILLTAYAKNKTANIPGHDLKR